MEGKDFVSKGGDFGVFISKRWPKKIYHRKTLITKKHPKLPSPGGSPGSKKGNGLLCFSKSRQDREEINLKLIHLEWGCEPDLTIR